MPERCDSCPCPMRPAVPFRNLFPCNDAPAAASACLSVWIRAVPPPFLLQAQGRGQRLRSFAAAAAGSGQFTSAARSADWRGAAEGETGWQGRTTPGAVPSSDPGAAPASCRLAPGGVALSEARQCSRPRRWRAAPRRLPLTLRRPPSGWQPPRRFTPPASHRLQAACFTGAAP